MKKHTVGRAAGFVGAAGLTAALVAAGVNMTGAYFQDTEQGSVEVSTGEVDLSVDSSTPLSQAFGPLLPGQSDSNTYTLRNVGSGPVDFHLGSINWDSFSVVRLDLNPGTDPDNNGVSDEFTRDDIQIQDGDTISFEYRMTGVSCGGGVPRMFVQGGAYNTFDGGPSLASCGEDTDGDGWFEVSQTLSGIGGPSPAGLIGLVNDQIADHGVIEYRNVTLAGEALLPDFDHCAEHEMLVRLIGPNADTGELDLCNLPASLPALATNVAPGQARNVQVILELEETADNGWANTIGTADLLAIATQAGQAIDPTQVVNGDQSHNDAP